jgi:hypothetical protein
MRRFTVPEIPVNSNIVRVVTLLVTVRTMLFTHAIVFQFILIELCFGGITELIRISEF